MSKGEFIAEHQRKLRFDPGFHHAARRVKNMPAGFDAFFDYGFDADGCFFADNTSAAGAGKPQHLFYKNVEFPGFFFNQSSVPLDFLGISSRPSPAD